MMQSREDMQRFFAAKGFREPELRYLRFHARRYAGLLDTVRSILDAAPRDRQRGLSLLDVGMSYQTALLQNTFPDVEVSTLGFRDHRFDGAAKGRHYEFDLNEAQYPERCPEAGPFSVVVMAEVIEHLYTSPVLVLRCVRHWLLPGGFVVLQTPNGISIGRRWQMLRGRYPLELIREDRRNPGHFREYTRGELAACGIQAGLEVVRAELHSYFGESGWKEAFCSVLFRLFPLEWQEGITMVYRRPVEDLPAS